VVSGRSLHASPELVAARPELAFLTNGACRREGAWHTDIHHEKRRRIVDANQSRRTVGSSCTAHRHTPAEDIHKAAGGHRCSRRCCRTVPRDIASADALTVQTCLPDCATTLRLGLVSATRQVSGCGLARTVAVLRVPTRMPRIAFLVSALLPVTTVGLDHALAVHTDLVRARACVPIITLRTAGAGTFTRINPANLHLAGIAGAFRVRGACIRGFTRSSCVGLLRGVSARGVANGDRIRVRFDHGSFTRPRVLLPVARVSILQVALWTPGVYTRHRACKHGGRQRGTRDVGNPHRSPIALLTVKRPSLERIILGTLIRSRGSSAQFATSRHRSPL
jgi:hypothetical protein